jgi:hypothetical protein
MRFKRPVDAGRLAVRLRIPGEDSTWQLSPPGRQPNEATPSCSAHYGEDCRPRCPAGTP